MADRIFPICLIVSDLFPDQFPAVLRVVIHRNTILPLVAAVDCVPGIKVAAKQKNPRISECSRGHSIRNFLAALIRDSVSHAMRELRGTHPSRDKRRAALPVTREADSHGDTLKTLWNVSRMGRLYCPCFPETVVLPRGIGTIPEKPDSACAPLQRRLRCP